MGGWRVLVGKAGLGKKKLRKDAVENRERERERV